MEAEKRARALKTHEQQSEKHGTHRVARSSFSRVDILGLDLLHSYAYINLGEQEFEGVNG